MTIIFMSLLATVISETISFRAGLITLAPLLMLGAGSVLWWHYTETRGAGDLRAYILVQYYPVILIPALLLLFPTPACPPAKSGWPPLLWAFAWYGVAKIFDQHDCSLFRILHVVSGHTLKHLAAAAATTYLVTRSRRLSPHLSSALQSPLSSNPSSP